MEEKKGFRKGKGRGGVSQRRSASHGSFNSLLLNSLLPLASLPWRTSISSLENQRSARSEDAVSRSGPCCEQKWSILKIDWFPSSVNLKQALETYGYLLDSSFDISSLPEVVHAAADFDCRGPPQNIRCLIKFLTACCGVRGTMSIFSTSEAKEFLGVIISLFLDRQLQGLSSLLFECMMAIITCVILIQRGLPIFFAQIMGQGLRINYSKSQLICVCDEPNVDDLLAVLKVNNLPSVHMGSSNSSDDEHEVSTRKRKHSDHPRKAKEKDRGKTHRHKRPKHKVKEKMQNEENSSPVQLSKFLGRDKEDGVRRSAVSGKKILLKLEKSKEDKLAENNRNELLKFLNASYD
ncbi:hypothetical protein NE237_014678 [Protea cynaroides]|uniref:Uncharacterized protein n=1 Tax=Protea cynaroides TaxID=273540 RepID=A0A9Q0QQA9_9MAGN|nr:hypothetical protein NE237_014678 [Protea cynaroides]